MKRIRVPRQLFNGLQELAFQRGFRRKHDERFNFDDYEEFVRDGGVANESNS